MVIAVQNEKFSLRQQRLGRLRDKVERFGKAITQILRSVDENAKKEILIALHDNGLVMEAWPFPEQQYKCSSRWRQIEAKSERSKHSVEMTRKSDTASFISKIEHDLHVRWKMVLACNFNLIDAFRGLDLIMQQERDLFILGCQKDKNLPPAALNRLNNVIKTYRQALDKLKETLKSRKYHL